MCLCVWVQVMVVQSLDKADKERYLVEVAEGDKGYLITRGQNLMSGYVHGEEATRKYVLSASYNILWMSTCSLRQS